jgi:lipoic acid synthetase
MKIQINTIHKSSPSIAEPMPPHSHLPPWLKRDLGGGEKFVHIQGLLVTQSLNTVCRSAKCPNLGECWSRGTATFMIMGDKCTRQCPFCAIGHTRPDPLRPDEPCRLAEAARDMGLKWVVVTSVDRDDLKDGGAGHFAAVVRELRQSLPDAGIELLIPDFRKKKGAIETILADPPDVLNHNIETVQRLYKTVRPGADYKWSLDLLKCFADSGLVTKSGLFVGVGESGDELLQVLRDMREHGVRSLTVGQYLQATPGNLPVTRFYAPEEFARIAEFANSIGFNHVASGSFVRSSYRAEEAVDIYKLTRPVNNSNFAVPALKRSE